ncbi:MAG: DUF2298 domain-containing protein [Anaerolineae bacterium]|nr:DUF2298 domain-containing protein [Anaerolineae bacterium]
MLDWLAREGWIIASWWLIVTLCGVAVWPLVWRAFASLPDRGIVLARAAGLMLVTVVYWLLGTLGFVRADESGMLVAFGLVVLASVWAGRRLPDLSGQPAPTVRAWWREHRTAVIVGEVLFIALLVGWAAVRAHQNNLVTTEKPMDLAFTASVWRGEAFPPQDPWLSGYAISYYYLGYIMAGSLSKLSGVYPSLGYNLWTAMLAALAGLTAFGVVYNLVRARRVVGAVRGAAFGLVGAAMLTLMGNYLTPLVDLPYYSGTASPSYLQFWDVRDRIEPRYPEGMAAPDGMTLDYWWWFRSARVITDRNFEALGGGTEEVINEFPAFSYLLADNHPHVMALPFLVLAMGAALSVALNRRTPTVWHTVLLAALAGSLIFMNTWDAPAALGLTIAAEALRRRTANDGRWSWEDTWYLGAFALTLVGVALLMYAPFLISFSSQLGGALPNLWHPTRFRQIFLTFGALVPLTALALLIEARLGGRGLNWRAGLLTAGAAFGLLLLAFGFFVLLGALFPNALGGNQQRLMATPDLLDEVLARRLEYGLTTVLLLAGIAVVAARLFGRDGQTGEQPPVSSGFALLMFGAAFLLVLAPEWVYLRDGFGQRMNTIFKFYYQAWALLTLATAYGLSVWMSEAGRLPMLARGVGGVFAFTCIGLGMIYLAYAIPFVNPVPITLDGGASLTRLTDYEALVCLRDLTRGRTDVVVAETTFGGSYDYYAGGIASGRVTGITGLPTVLGWQGHQRQWRGIVFGPAERERYGADGELKFIEALQVVCESGETRIYRADPAPLAASLPN